MIDSKLAKATLLNWGGLSFKCSCGQRHEMNVKEVVLRDDACSLIPFFVKKFGRTVHVVFESDVKNVSESKVTKKLQKGFAITESVVSCGNMLQKTECDKIIGEISEETKVILCVGGANANEFGKYASAKLDLPWIFLNIVPNSDNLITNFSMLWKDNIKQMFEGNVPDILLCDVDLAFELSSGKTNSALALVYRNMLTVFDNDFSSVVQKTHSCKILNYVITTAVKDSVLLVQKPYSKNLVREIMSNLIKISLAKGMANVNVEYLTSILSMTYLLQNKYPNLSEAGVASCLFDSLAKVYQVILNTDPNLSVDKDRFNHTTELKTIFGLDVESSYVWDFDDKAFHESIEDFKKKLILVSKVLSLALAVSEKKTIWETEVAMSALKVASDVYSFNGLLNYANNKGLFDMPNEALGQEDVCD